MKKKLIAVAIMFALMLTITACSETKDANIVTDSNVTYSESGLLVNWREAMKPLGDRLYYDSTTRIVYWWTGRLSSESDVLRSNFESIPSPYYAPNGLPYKYNPETNALEEINTNTSIDADVNVDTTIDTTSSIEELFEKYPMFKNSNNE